MIPTIFDVEYMFLQERMAIQNKGREEGKKGGYFTFFLDFNLSLYFIHL